MMDKKVFAAVYSWRGRCQGLYFLSFVIIGLMLANLGPIVLELSSRTGASIATLGWVFGVRSVGYMVGCAAAGGSYDAKRGAHGHALLAGSLIVSAVSNALVPLCKTVAALAGSIFAQGVGFGFLDTGGNIMTMRLHPQKRLPPFLQALHLNFGFGALAAPLLIHASIDRLGEFDVSFFGMSAFAVLVSLPLLCLKPPLAERGDDDDEAALCDDAAHATGTSSSLATRLVGTAPGPARCVAVATGTFLFLYVGTEVTYGAFLTAFTTQYKERGGQHLTEATGQLVTSVYWGSLTAGRLLAVFLSMRLRPATLLRWNVVGCVFASSAIAIAEDSVPVLWAASGVFGLSMASSFPSAMNLSQEYITVTGRVQGFINVMACMGEVVIPIAAAYILEFTSGNALMILVAVLSAASGVAVASVSYSGRQMARRGEKMGLRQTASTSTTENGRAVAKGLELAEKGEEENRL